MGYGGQRRHEKHEFAVLLFFDFDFDDGSDFAFTTKMDFA